MAYLGLANAVVMVTPRAFGFNSETGEDNEFQHKLSLNSHQLKMNVAKEFAQMRDSIRKLGIKVVEFDNGREDTPDAVFPNNWFTTDKYQQLVLYPMLCPNRQSEIQQQGLIHILKEHQYSVQQCVDLRGKDGVFEGTGALIIDHANNIGFCALSQRAEPQMLPKVAHALKLDAIYGFETETSTGASVYHTNVLMSVGPEYAVVCMDVVKPEYQVELRKRLNGKHLIEISEQQMQQFCGNVLQLQSATGENHIMMSQSAFNAFTPSQKRLLEQCGQLNAFDIHHIETVGGGSVRCMLAELFL